MPAPTGWRAGASSSQASADDHRCARAHRDARRHALDRADPSVAPVDRDCRPAQHTRHGKRVSSCRASSTSCFGVDHLLFVLGLLLLVEDRWMLVKTITAFTVAHSITLALATLGYANVPAPPLNAAIALSILFLGPRSCARGAARRASRSAIPGSWRSRSAAARLRLCERPDQRRPAAGRHPAGAAHVQRRRGDRAARVRCPDIALARAFKVIEVHWPRPVEFIPAYVIGSLGAFWVIQRTVLMLNGG